MKDAIADYRETDDPDYQEDVNDGVEFVQERVCDTHICLLKLNQSHLVLLV